MDLVARWLPILKKWNLPEDKYQEAANKLEEASKVWKPQYGFPQLDQAGIDKIIKEELPKIERLFREGLCRCDTKIILSQGCQCGGN